MKLDSIVPNAHYDNEHGQPKVIEKDNDGSFLYRYNIKPEMKIPEGEKRKGKLAFHVVKSAYGSIQPSRY